MQQLEALLKNRPVSQVYLWNTLVQIDAISDLVKQWGFRFFYINGEIVTDSLEFLSQAKFTMEIPYSSNNWDALDDSMCELSWITEKSYILFYDHFQQFAYNDPDGFALAIDVFQTVTENHRNFNPDNRFYILLRGDTQFISSEIPILGNE